MIDASKEFLLAEKITAVKLGLAMYDSVRTPKTNKTLNPQCACGVCHFLQFIIPKYSIYR